MLVCRQTVRHHEPTSIANDQFPENITEIMFPDNHVGAKMSKGCLSRRATRRFGDLDYEGLPAAEINERVALRAGTYLPIEGF